MPFVTKLSLIEWEIVVFLIYKNPTLTIALLRDSKNFDFVTGSFVRAKSSRGMSLNAEGSSIWRGEDS
jgi:hypothetical protein